MDRALSAFTKPWNSTTRSSSAERTASKRAFATSSTSAARFSAARVQISSSAWRSCCSRSNLLASSCRCRNSSRSSCSRPRRRSPSSARIPCTLLSTSALMLWTASCTPWTSCSVFLCSSAWARCDSTPWLSELVASSAKCAWQASTPSCREVAASSSFSCWSLFLDSRASSRLPAESATRLSAFVSRLVSCWDNAASSLLVRSEKLKRSYSDCLKAPSKFMRRPLKVSVNSAITVLSCFLAKFSAASADALSSASRSLWLLSLLLDNSDKSAAKRFRLSSAASSRSFAASISGVSRGSMAPHSSSNSSRCFLRPSSS
mmetsp:Transcript_95208/g.226699  ORF Transcript_95208/g.226699 Transcript_95208/m.226699 type:complete len:318 (+) Transcript_95208:558-1511(+)